MYHVWSKEDFRQNVGERNVILIKQGKVFNLKRDEVMPISSFPI